MNPNNIYLTNDILLHSHRREQERQRLINEARSQQRQPRAARSLPLWTLILRTFGR
jgi:hypothetical protein